MHFPRGMHEMNYGRDVGGLAPDSLIFLQRFHSGEANMSDIPIRPEVRAFEPYTAGLSIDEIREKYHLDRVVKMASNENPLGVSPVVRRVIAERAGLAFRYPQAGNPKLSAALGARHGVSADRIVAGNGSDEIIDLLFRVCATPGVHNAVAFRPCFGLYPTQSALCGVELRRADLNPDMSFPWERLLSQVDASTALVFVTTPDNPSGRAASRQELADLAARLPASCLLVIDEAYMDFTDDPHACSLLSDMRDGSPLADRVAVLRTFSKLFGLAGLRLGYGILPPDIADYMRRVRLPFSVNLLAEEAALAALGDETFRAKTLEVTRAGRAMLGRELAALGCRVYPSQSNFIMFEPPEAVDSARLFEDLLRRGFILRPLGGYGLPRHLRVSVGTAEENEGLVAALGELLRSAA